MSTTKEACPEFPFFGARYPDATCIDGYLWDLDSYEDGGLTIGGESPCPFCNTEEFIKGYEDGDNPKRSREAILSRIEAARRRYGKIATLDKEARSDES